MKRMFFAFAALGLLASSSLAAPTFFEPHKTVDDFKLALNGVTAKDATAHGLLAATVVSTLTENDPGFTTTIGILPTIDGDGSTAMKSASVDGGTVYAKTAVNEWSIAPPVRKPIHQTEPSFSQFPFVGDKVAMAYPVGWTPARSPVDTVV